MSGVKEVIRPNRRLVFFSPPTNIYPTRQETVSQQGENTQIHIREGNQLSCNTFEECLFVLEAGEGGIEKEENCQLICSEWVFDWQGY